MKKNYFYAIIFVFFICRKPIMLFPVEYKNENRKENPVKNENLVKSGKTEKFSEILRKNFFNVKQPNFNEDFSLTFYGDNKKDFAVDLKTSLSQMKFSFCENNFNFGISAFSYKFLPSIPFVLKAGNLTESGSLSKLKSLLLSGGNSPFSVDFCNVNGIYSNLPGYTSFSKPVSTFTEIGFINKKSRLKEFKLNCFYSPEKENLAFSFLAKSSFLKNKIKTAFSITSGFFSYEEHSGSSWFSEDLFFQKGNHLCSLYQLSVEIPLYKTSFSLGSYENPFGKISNVYRWDNYCSLKNISISFSAYYNPNSEKDEVLSASGNVLQNVFQLRTSFVHKIRLKTGFVRNGFLAYLKTDISDNSSDAKISLGSQFNSSLCSISFYIASNCKIISEENVVAECDLKDININLSNRWYFSLLSPALYISSGFSFYDNYKTVNSTSKITAKVYFQRKSKINAQSSYAFSVKNGEFSSQYVNFAVYAKFNIKKVNFLCNLGWKTEL